MGGATFFHRQYGHKFDHFDVALQLAVKLLISERTRNTSHYVVKGMVRSRRFCCPLKARVRLPIRELGKLGLHPKLAPIPQYRKVLVKLIFSLSTGGASL